jgi:hypothetical protein
VQIFLVTGIYFVFPTIKATIEFMVNHSFKMRPSSICVSSANAICKDSDIFNKDYI